MTMKPYQPEPSRASIEQLAGPVVLEFGENWCGFCRAAQPLIEEALAEYKRVRHIKVQDGKGRPLGRHYQVKLWPTLIFLCNGKEIARLVRPEDSQAVREALAQIA
jgi:thioredoxin 1